MRLSNQLTEQLIKTRKIYNDESGIDRLPGDFLLLDSDLINYENNVIHIILYAWYEKECKEAKSFIIEYRCNIIFIDLHYQAVAVYENLINKYGIQE